MSDPATLPSEIKIEETASGFRCRLPVRQVTPGLWKVLAKLLLGGLGMLVIGSVMVFSIAGTRSLGIGVCLAVAGVCALGIGLAFLVTRASLELQGRILVLTEWLGPISRQRVRRLDQLRRIASHRQLDGEPGQPLPNGILEIVCAGAQTLWFATGYPYDWLTALGAHLAIRCLVPHVEVPLEESPVV
jgi:hypothetical protein